MVRAPVALVVFALLLAAVLGGLLRAGVALLPLPSTLALRLADSHGYLMISAWLGTAVSIERAVALRKPWAWVAPAASIGGGVSLLCGWRAPAAALAVAAALALSAVSAVLVRRQPALHTRLLLLAALTWLAGNLLYLLQSPLAAVILCWFSFLLGTVAAERLELTRLMRRPPWVEQLLLAALALLPLAIVAALVNPDLGHGVFGVALLLLAAWLARFDIARKTVRTTGLSAYMAWCLLLGYAWLAVAGMAWIALACGMAARDPALHALGLGFVMSMVMGHAPVIVPAVSGVGVRFHRVFVVPLALLQLSLLLRMAAPWLPDAWRSAGAAGNALALALFLLTLASSLRSRTSAATRVR